jgi:hypothetical protein
MRTNYYIVCKSQNIGGTAVVIKFLKNKFKAKIINPNLKFIISNSSVSDIYIAIQPTGVFFLFLKQLINRSKQFFYIFDTHPLSINSSTKRIIYILTAFFLFLLNDKTKLIIPDGQLLNIWPFCKFTNCSWRSLVKKRFTLHNLEEDKPCFFYYGTISKFKKYYNFIKFAKANNNFHAYSLGYLEMSISKEDNQFYKGILKNSFFAKSDIMVWTSFHESYGLSYREYVKSGGNVLFLRDLNPYDGIKNAIYYNCKDFSSVGEIIFEIIKNFPQVSMKSYSINFGLHIKKCTA